MLLGSRPGLVAELNALRSAAARALADALEAGTELEVRAAELPFAPGRVLGHSALFCVLALTGPGSEAVLELDLRLAASLAAIRTGAPPPDAPVLAVTPFERALVGELLLSVLAALREVRVAESRWRPRLVQVGASRNEAGRRLGAGPSLLLELGLGPSSVRGRAVLHVPELSLRAVALQVPVTRSQFILGGGPGSARIQFSPRVRCGALWPHELAILLRGAAVVLPGARLDEGQLHASVLLARPGVALAGTLSSAGFSHAHAELNLASQEVTHVDPALSELPVEVQVELAHLSVSLEELGALQPGAVLPLRVRSGDPVFLRAGDRRIARAELVEVEGEVAARILELVP